MSNFGPNYLSGKDMVKCDLCKGEKFWVVNRDGMAFLRMCPACKGEGLVHRDYAKVLSAIRTNPAAAGEKEK